MIQHISYGLTNGVLISFIAIGFALIYSILRFIDFAHADRMALGAYLFSTLYFLINSFWVSALVAVLVTGCFGLLTERFVYRPVRERGRTTIMLLSFGLSIITQAILALIFGTATLGLRISETVVQVAGLSFYVREFVVAGLLLSLFIALELWLGEERTGRGVRAVACNPVLATLYGLPMDRLISQVYFIASGLAAIAGISVGIAVGVAPHMGFRYLIWAFTAAVVGGIGSLRGTVLAGLLLGLILNLAEAYYSALFANGLALAIIVIVLIFRPQGLFTFQRRIA